MFGRVQNAPMNYVKVLKVYPDYSHEGEICSRDVADTYIYIYIYIYIIYIYIYIYDIYVTYSWFIPPSFIATMTNFIAIRISSLSLFTLTFWYILILIRTRYKIFNILARY